MSNFGVGIPIYVDLRGLAEIPDESYASNASLQRDPRLGISIGILLSVLCVSACIFIIVRHRKCSKSPHRQNANGNNGNARGSIQNRSPLNRSPVAGTTTIGPATSAQVPNCTTDAHELQSLIVTSNIESLPCTNGNGATKKLDNHINGVMVVPCANRNNTNAHSDDVDNSDLSRCGLISSTPKSKHKPIIVKNDHLKNTSTNFGSHTANPVEATVYRRIDCDLDALGAETATNLLCNGSLQQMKTTLPPNKSVHSILFNTTNEIPPTIKRIDNDTVVKVPKRSSAHMSNASIPSILDDSQQSLLPDTNATESSSASTSSGSVPMDRLNNKPTCIFDVNTFDNVAPHSICENPRYMRSAALV